MSEYAYLMNTATVLYIVCYVPELYANYKNKNANCWNIPEKVVILVGSIFALSYSIMLEDKTLMLNYGSLFVLDFVAFVMRAYYACKNCKKQEDPIVQVWTRAPRGEFVTIEAPKGGLNSVLDGIPERECQGPQKISTPSSV